MLFPYPEQSPIPKALFEQKLLKYSDSFALGESVTLVHEEQSHPYIYVLAAGWVIYSKSLADGSRQVLNIALPGELIGYTSENDDAVDYTIRALTRCQFYRLKKSQFLDAVIGDVDLGKCLIQWQDQDYSHCNKRLLVVGQAPAINKVAYLFLNLLERLGVKQESAIKTIPVPLEREDIADFVGVSKVHISRILVELKQKSVIYHRSGVLTLYNINDLKKLANSI